MKAGKARQPPSRASYSHLSDMVRCPAGSGITKRLSGHSSQEVCPWNSEKFVQITDEPAFRPREGVHGAALIELMRLTPEGFRKRFRKSPVKRAKRRGLLRNVAVALGNWRSAEAVPALLEALDDDEPLVRGHSAWALGRIASADETLERVTLEIARALGERLAVEGDGRVREEIGLAIPG